MANVAQPFDALVANDSAGALAWYEKRREGLAGYPHHLHAWARLLCSLGRPAEAEPLFDHLAQSEEFAMFAAGQRLIGSLEGGLAPEQALGLTPLGAAAPYREAIATAMAEFDLARRPPEARHIAICGVSYCGSTLLDLLLEGVPGVASIGESVWLTLSYVDGQSVPRDYSLGHGAGIPECNFCGANCEFLTPTFRTILGLDPADWYFRIAERFGTRVLVSADKNLPKIVLFDPLLRLQGLVVFKSPKQAWASEYTKMRGDLPRDTYFEAMIRYMRVWKEVYAELTGPFSPRDGKVFFDFERFAEAPQVSLASLAGALRLEHHSASLLQPSPGHSLGGNGNAFRRVRAAGYHADVQPFGEPPIPADHARWIDQQAVLGDLHAEMRQLSEDLLGPAA